ncbi:DNA mismatch repair protein MutS [Sutterella sp.]|uniref:DNA mismatch repair protein MutS n=1 Tax=Sutterella sp. TaxID=1981025 RepID=UPI0026E08D12|nr:DNA mismatch repair protein MutS [Sutterella sp.]MDO5530993.1 DNA mismatch repair protein MutS [Sutterella sp.]
MEEPAAQPDFTNLALFTPSIRQFIEVKNHYPQTLVLFRMGDFYETFFDDAVKANRLIGITLTKRGKLTDGTPIPMAGVPAVSLDTYVSRLVRMGESVVIVEQVGQPGKGMIDRRVSRIITPGTLTDTSLLPEKSDAILLAISWPARKSDDFGFVWLTLSNGDFRAERVSPEAFESALARISPSEVLVSEKHRNELRDSHPGLVVSSLPDWHFDAKHGTEALCKLFGLSTLDAWGVSDMPGVLAAANAVLDYTKETQVDMVPFIEPLKLVEESEFVVLDASSRRNLEIDASLSATGEGPTLFSVLDHCETAMGSRELRRWLNQPVRSAEKARARHEVIASFVANPEMLEAVRKALNALPDVERISSRIALGTVRPRELAALRDAAPVIDLLARFLADRPEPAFPQMSAAMRIPEAIGKTLAEALVPEPPALLRDGDVIASAWNAELAELRHFRDDTGRILLEMEQQERAATGIGMLRVQYNKVSGFYIEIPKAHAVNTPVRYQRRQTLKNCERFITPELKSLEDRVLSAKDRSQTLEKELYDRVVAEIGAHAEALLTAARTIARLDVLTALALHAKDAGWVRPVLSARPGIRIERGRHPVVETTIEGFVPNSCRLEDGRRMLIITGPNMGGKSTFMRSVALIALLAWAGSFVPADAAEIGPVDRIHTRIGASDDLARGRSTFMVEMTEAAGILSQATDRSLVLMDEIGRGTSTYDGLSLAAAIAQELVQVSRSFTLFATHYFELTALAQEVREVANIHFSASQTRTGVVFRHECSEGPASKSYGIAVAQLAGVPAPVVRRAKSFLARLEERAAAPGAVQPDLFGGGLPMPADEPAADPADETPAAPDPALAAFVNRVAATDTDSLTPRAALDLLYELAAEAARLRDEAL